MKYLESIFESIDSYPFEYDVLKTYYIHKKSNSQLGIR